eukprot:CAMPEP_0181168396 /NCGR_PEP_ID=MMETSP1096-20121128/250_1 /TAXON_ID=156174 ORGANISM="Chrysochromulina ericina, Strain CCMP281" /NCGR_SAMPLE_ID=MMETSP1096 /ASSEMBLY_ACC=CAM_ASM_000453 /LENGTH=110 /DNA_ID=CAMNT_0023255767 /DNA_START=1187 /DNA_END=1519 /DNA_ORIENTATION=-
MHHIRPPEDDGSALHRHALCLHPLAVEVLALRGVQGDKVATVGPSLQHLLVVEMTARPHLEAPVICLLIGQSNRGLDALKAKFVSALVIVVVRCLLTTPSSWPLQRKAIF